MSTLRQIFTLFILVAVAVPMQGQSQGPIGLSEPPQSAQEACGKKLALLCSSHQSMQRLTDGSVLVVGGVYGDSAVAGDGFIFNFDKKEITNRERIIGTKMFRGTAGFQLSDYVYAFSGRMLSENSIGRSSQEEQSLVLWSAKEKKFTSEVRFNSLTTVTTPTLLRPSGEPGVVHFYGHEASQSYGTPFPYEENQMDDGQGGTTDYQRYQVDAYPVKLDPAQALSDFSSTGVPLGSLRRGRIQFDTATFADGRMFIAGGQEQAREGALNIPQTAEYFLPGKGWFETSPSPKPVKDVRTFGIDDQTALVVEMGEGQAWTWSFKTKEWTSAFKIGTRLSKLTVHSSGVVIGIAKAKSDETERFFIWNEKGEPNFIDSDFPFVDGVGLVELNSGNVLEAQPSGLLVWDIGAKSKIRVKR